MISGISRAAKEINPRVKIIGVEPAKIPSMALALGQTYSSSFHQSLRMYTLWFG